MSDTPLLSPARPTLSDILQAAEKIKTSVLRTPTLPADRLSQELGAEIFVKYDNMQITNAFKERGALNKLLSLSKTQKSKGVIAMSAGNHAQAVALHATRLGIPSTIVMPEFTPFVKVAATKAFGATVILEGESVAEAGEAAHALAIEKDLTFVHPYDDFHVIAGQGTVALEMLADEPDLDVLIIPIGGGGLISGVSIAAKALKPQIEIIGVETELYPTMYNELKKTNLVCGGQSLAEGIAVKKAGKLPALIASDLVSDIILVSERQIEQAINAYATYLKTMAEGAGAAGLAAMIAEPERFKGKKVGLVLCGGNIDPRLLSSIIVRQLGRKQQIVGLRITIPDRPGVLGEISTVIGDLGGNVLEVDHHRTFLNVPVRGASIDITIETRDAAHAQEIIQGIEAKGHQVEHLNAPENTLKR
ncbi:threonine ammonia-lyase [Cohaesibacter celericrescens]|uniref:Threonine ammonia-lyase n=1 Tax=Cohaesibacter celericrescens TaxID=2067669 RepID=A0A2N5XQN6_9HYPH|nr:threonine ammonia-lyase [Cohaesibacter celericrescens]PLW76728.1 threonine ammonia-lyase [Cohaesibacter celericrescens]